MSSFWHEQILLWNWNSCTWEWTHLTTGWKGKYMRDEKFLNYFLVWKIPFTSPIKFFFFLEYLLFWSPAKRFHLKIPKIWFFTRGKRIGDIRSPWDSRVISKAFYPIHFIYKKKISFGKWFKIADREERRKRRGRKIVAAENPGRKKRMSQENWRAFLKKSEKCSIFGYSLYSRMEKNKKRGFLSRGRKGGGKKKIRQGF